jgi:proteasome activator subunit 4
VQTSATPAADAATELPAQALSVLGLGLQLCSRGLNAVDPGCLRPWLLALLPHLFRMQELRGPQLQKLSLESRVALAQLKHLPLRACDVPAVVDAVCGAVASHVWSARAAGLLFTQYFWFRRCFVLGGEQLATLQAAVVGRLADTKAEVRAAATATLAGMIKGMPDAEADALRVQVLARARDLLGGKRRAGAPGGGGGGGDPGGAAAALLPKHGAVLGLKAFLMSAPYDVHAWTPSVLLALVPGAGSRQPAAVRAEASQALAEFKRTHEQDSLALLRADMGADDWESFQAVTSSASYFA